MYSPFDSSGESGVRVTPKHPFGVVTCPVRKDCPSRGRVISLRGGVERVNVCIHTMVVFVFIDSLAWWLSRESNSWNQVPSSKLVHDLSF